MKLLLPVACIYCSAYLHGTQIGILGVRVQADMLKDVQANWQQELHSVA